MSDRAAPVTVRLKGGLGNQLFQYAAARAVSIEQDRPLRLDTGWYERRGRGRHYRLREFRIAGRDIPVSKARHRALAAWLALPRPFGGAGTFVSEPSDHGYRPIQARSGAVILMEGYWQSERYFREHRATLLEELSPVAGRSTGAEPSADSSATTSSATSTAPPVESCVEPGSTGGGGSLTTPIDGSVVAVHVRRGDYLAGGEEHVVSEAYVRRAMASFGANADFLFFSDDMAWCRERFAADNVAFAENGSDVQDLLRMSAAAHNIIANSSFSWWAAWLNPNPGRRVVAPRPWTPHGSHADIVAEGWETMPIDGA